MNRIFIISLIIFPAILFAGMAAAQDYDAPDYGGTTGPAYSQPPAPAKPAPAKPAPVPLKLTPPTTSAKPAVIFVNPTGSASRQAAPKPAAQPRRQGPSAPDEEAPLEATPQSAIQTVRDETIDGRGIAASSSGSLVRVRTKSNFIFTGTVTAIDSARKTISVKSAGKNLTFDLVNPVVRGYSNASAIAIGDTVSLGYITNGIGIVKGENFPEDLKAQTAADEPATSRSRKGQANHAKPVRVKYRVNTLNFKDVDNNKDGKISPVELATVLPSITMDEFKRYDRNGDGGLDESEYRAVRKR